MEYEVRLPSSMWVLKINKGKGRGTTVIGDLFSGDRVTVEEVCGERARISYPKQGWCTMKNVLSADEFLFEVIRKSKPSNVSKIDKALSLSRQDYYKKKISEIECCMQAIINGEEVNIDEKNAIDELGIYKTFYMELLCPEMNWECNRCTFINTPQSRQCSICATTRPTTLPTLMAMKLENFLSQRRSNMDEKEEIMLLEAKMQSPMVVDKLEKQVDYLSQKYGKVAQQVEELEEANWCLSGRLVNVERTLSSCVLDTTHPKTWDVLAVSSWLDRLGAEEYQMDFAEAMIDGSNLLSCDAKKLEELDVRRKHRPMILKGIEQLREKWNEESSYVREPTKQFDESMSPYGKKTNPILEVTVTTNHESHAKEKINEQSVSRFFNIKPRGSVADDFREVCTSTRSKTKLVPQNDSGDGWQLLGDV